MALINCPDCGHEVSSDAPQCPNCGRPIAFEGADLVRHLQAQQGDGPPVGSPEAAVDDSRDRQRVWAWVMVVAGASLVVGSLLPWATLTAPFVGTVNVTATDGDGMLTIFAGFALGLIGILGLVRGVGIPGLVVAFLALVLAAFVVAVDFGNVNDMVTEVNTDEFGAASVGIGLWLVAVATVVGLGGWVGLLVNR